MVQDLLGCSFVEFSVPRHHDDLVTQSVDVVLPVTGQTYCRTPLRESNISSKGAGWRETKIGLTMTDPLPALAMR